MIKNPAYTDISVSTLIYCSSTGHYSGHCSFSYRGAFLGRMMMIPELTLFNKIGIGTIETPRYVQRILAAQLLSLMNRDMVRFYEVDREGVKRFENLRYHDRRQEAWIADRLRAKL